MATAKKVESVEPVYDEKPGAASASDQLHSLSQAKQLIEEQEKKIKGLLDQQRILSEKNRGLEESLELIWASKSWRITAPLRKITEIVKGMFPLWRSRRYDFEFKSGRNTTVQGASVSVHGSSPTIEIAPVQGSCPGGWAVFEGELSSDNDHLFFFLYYRRGPSFAETDRVWLPFEQGKVTRQVIYFPYAVTGLRIDPFETEAKFAWKSFSLTEIGKLQVLAELFRKHLGHLALNPAMAWTKVKKAWAVYREGGLTAIRVKLFADNYTSNYAEWVKQYDTLDDSDRKAIRTEIESWSSTPRISVIMPTYNTPVQWLRAAIESVRRQLYPNWELCIADDASSDTNLRQLLEEYRSLDSRIKITLREKNGHIVEATNSALALATGEYLALLDHDDELSEHALYLVAKEILAYPEAELVYSDEDKLTSYGMRFNPHFKSDWNPDLLLSQNFICHLGVYKTKTVRELGGFRKGTEGAQDWDLAWRVADAARVAVQSGASSRAEAAEKLRRRIRHIPHVLYHWRVIEGSTAQSTSFKPYVLQAQQKTVQDHLQRVGVSGADVRINEGIAQLEVRFPIPSPEPLVSLIIPTRDKVKLLSRCVSSILEKTAYKNFEIIIVDNGSVEAATKDYFTSLSANKQVRIVEDSLPFNFSRINNLAAKLARGSFLGFINNDLEVIEPEWLGELVSQAARDEVGAAGARLYFPNDLLQHGGIILGIGGVAGHNHKGRRRGDPGYFNRIILAQDLSAVTAACMVMRREVFDEVQGFDEQALSVAFNDVDLCLRVREKGYWIVYAPRAELYHYESASRGYENTPEKFLRFESEIENMKKRWGHLLKADPFYNPNLTLITEDFSFAFPPRKKLLTA